MGLISFERVSVGYRNSGGGIMLALRDLTFQVRAGEKLGIVGRTGAGKSSIFMALFRMIPLRSGRITIDGLDCARISLQDLRTSITIIPQDPVLFSGSIRFNLDPTGLIPDDRIWVALELASLAEHVRSLGGLNSELRQTRRAFSVGQKQLLCLARAVLRGSKILCLDEATASVDQKTDQVIQGTLRTDRFRDITLLTIAHRTATVLTYDRVLVIGDGRLLELDRPSSLMQRPDSHLARLVRAQ